MIYSDILVFAPFPSSTSTTATRNGVARRAARRLVSVAKLASKQGQLTPRPGASVTYENDGSLRGREP